MSIQFSGGSIQNTTFSGATTAALCTNIQQILGSAGWTIVSGSGTTNLLMQTALTPQNLQMRFKFHDNALTAGGTNTVQISLQTTNGSSTGTDGTLNAPWVKVNATTNFRMIAGPYYFWLVVPTSYTDFGFFACGGVPWIAAFQSTTTQLGYLVSQTGGSGNPTAVPTTFRNGNTCAVKNGTPRQQLLFNTTYVSMDGQSGFPNADLEACFLRPWAPAYKADFIGPTGFVSTFSLMSQFSDGSFATADPWIGWDIQRSGAPIAGDPANVMGMLWDAVLIYDSSQAGDTTATFDGHNWFAISNLQLPTLWVATS